MFAGKAITKLLLLNILIAFSSSQLPGQPASGIGGHIPPDAISQENAFIVPVNGEALLFNDAAGVNGATFLSNVYKSFGLSPDSRYFLYLKANGKFPTFSLFCRDISRKTETKISNNAVHYAAWAPSGLTLAYIWLDSAGLFHVSVYDLTTGSTTEVGSGRLRPQFLEWSPNGSELLYVSVTPSTPNGIELAQIDYTLHRYNVRQQQETKVPDVEWAQFSGQQLMVLGKKIVSGFQNVQRPNRENIRRFIVNGGQIYASVVEQGRSVFKRWNFLAGTFDTVGRGDVFLSNARGIVLREFTASGVTYQFLPKDAQQPRFLTSSIGTSTQTAADVSSKDPQRAMSAPQAGPTLIWKMPFAGQAYVVQGGEAYTNGACDGTTCFITAHRQELEYNLDWQQRPEEGQGNTHVVVSADGTVAGRLNNVTCNSNTTSCSVGWDNYSSNCVDPTSGIGNYVSVAHLDGTYSFYGHLRSGTVQVAVNQNVLQGTYLADQGHSGAAGTYNNYLSCGDHLHFSRQIGPAPWEQSLPTDFTELPCLLGCPTAYPSANVEIAGAPAITNVTPASGIAGSAPQITITGNNFVYGSTVSINNPLITVGSVLLASGTKITAALSIPLGTTPGSYSLTVTTPNGTSNGSTFTVLPNTTGGALTGTVTPAAGTYNLTALGSADWAHWGLTSATSFNRKSGVTQQISNFTVVGSGSAANYSGDTVGFTWTGGTPTASATNTTTGVYRAGLNNGFRFTVPADTNPRTLTVYFGVWAARGRLVAHLSDNSAADYVDTSLNNVDVGRGQYSINYRAASSGQTLTVTYTVDLANSGSSSNVSLQAATLVEGPFSVSATPASQTVAAGANTSYTVNVTAQAGFSGSVALSISGLPSGATGTFTPASVTGSGSSTLAITAGGGTSPGTYPITITGTNGSVTRTATATLIVTAAPGSGMLNGSVSTPASSNNLTTLGTADWAHWGLTSPTSFNHKSGVTQQISNITVVGSGSIDNYPNDTVAFTWTGGTPTASATNTSTGVYISGVNNGIRFTVPADTTPRTLTAYFGVWAARGRLVAHLSDGSAADYVDTSVSNTTDIARGQYSLTYRAASSGQTLTITYTVDQSFSANWGNVSLQAAALIQGAVSPDFSLSGTPSTQSVVEGGSTSFTVNVSAIGGFSSSVALSAGGLPAGVTGTFTPGSVSGSGSSTLAITAATGTAPGTYPVTITGTSGALTRTANVSLTVTGAPDFTVSATPASRSVAAGGNTSYTVTIGALNGFSSGIALSASGLPAGVTSTFTPASVTGSGSSTLGITTGSGTAPGTYPVTITGTSGALTHTANVTLVITAAPDFTVSAAPPSQSVAAGGNTSYTVTIGALNGFSSSVALSASGLPAGVTGTFTPSSVSGAGSSTLGITTTSGAAAGTYPVTITGTSGAVTRTANVSLTITAVPDFTVSATPATRSVVAGGNTSYTVTIGALNGFSGTVALSASGLPSGVTGSFTPSSVSGSGSSTLGITTTSGAAAGTYPVTITGTSGAATRTANVSLTVTAAPDFTVSATPASQSAAAGGSTSYTATVGALNGFSGTVALSASGLPAGVTGTFTPASVSGSGSSTLAITTTSGAAVGTYPVTITGTSGAVTRTANVTLVITVVSAGGSLNGSMTTPPGSNNLATLGSADWAHWGLTSANSFNHKSGVTQQISNFTVVGSGSASRYTNDTIAFSWTGGTPTATATNTITGVYRAGQNNGFRFTVPADTNLRTLTVYFGVWMARGRLVAHLSDNSASDYIDTSLSNSGGVGRGQFAINYRAASSGQTLTITFTVDQSFSGNSGNVSLQAATLVNGPFVVSAAPASQSVAAGANTSYTVNVAGQTGFSGTVALSVSGLPSGATGIFTPASVNGSGSSTLAIAAGSGTVPGTYPLTITGTDGSTSRATSAALVVTAAPGSGLLNGSVTTPATLNNLTTLGTVDWAHWGLTSATSFNRKSGATQQISNFTVVGSGSAGNYGNDTIGFSWTGGTPTASATNTTTGVYLSGVDNGFRITVPASATPRTLTLYFGVWAARGRLVASLSDGSAVDFVDTSLNSTGGIARGQYALNYRAASSGQTLTVTFTVDQSFSGNFGNVSLQAATLQ